jgi:ring-1,2-phenylacetyl-CoA epoxidase subunit PaaD
MIRESEALVGQVWAQLEQVSDPEIPSISVVDMGMIHQVMVENGQVTVEITPTFVGCPALGIIEKNVADAIQELEGVSAVSVRFVYNPPWTSHRISEKGRANLQKYGIAPPPLDCQEGDMWTVECPYCHSPKTMVENLFGPTACRSIMYCTHCKNPFEVLKPIL